MSTESPRQRARWRIGPRLADLAARQLAFDSSRAIRRSMVLLLVSAAVVALLLGQDANWDLRNYHLYNGYALLQGRLAQDLAPAQMQSYFPPLLDVPYYLMVSSLPAPVAGVVLGMLHMLAALPLALLARRLVLGHGAQAWLVPLLVLAGLASPAFLSEFGTTMGDTSTAPFVLGALALVVPDAGRWRRGHLLWAGALLGLAVGLKLTNAIYAVALGMAMLAAPAPWRSRLSATTLVTGVALLVFAITAGPWFWALYSTHGNPLLPQFNHWFQAPLAQPVGVADLRWLPQTLGEAVLRPLLFTANPRLISEVALLQLIWPALFLATLAAAAVQGVRLLRRKPASLPPGSAEMQRMLLVFFAVGYVLWLSLFSIHRYLVVLELLAPLLLWWLVHRIFPSRIALKVAAWMIGACAAVALLAWNGWGHAGWTRDAFRVEVPAIADPATATVLMVGDEPQAWRIPFLPAELAFVGVGTNFPESPAYADEVRRRIAVRQGATYAMLPATHNGLQQSIARRNRIAGLLALDRGGCPLLRRLAAGSRSMQLVDAADTAEGRCRLAPAPGWAPGEEEGNAAQRDKAADILVRYGLVLDAHGCVRLDGFVGADPHPYQWCPVRAGD